MASSALAQSHRGRSRRGVFPVGAEVLPEVFQPVMADCLVLGGFEEVRPEVAELAV